MHCFRFPTRTQFRTLAEAEGLITEEGELITASHTFAIDEVGTITRGGEYDPETGEVIVAPTVLDGWHVNYQGVLPDGWEEFLVEPANPVRVWA
jgi:hypothetical protein